MNSHSVWGKGEKIARRGKGEGESLVTNIWTAIPPSSPSNSEPVHRLMHGILARVMITSLLITDARTQ